MWTTTDIRYLREHGSLGAEELAQRMGRSPAAVKRAASRFRISLRQPGSRRGRWPWLHGRARGAREQWPCR